jgi:hypothetical protein
MPLCYLLGSDVGRGYPLYGILGLGSPFASWVVGTGFDGMCIGAMLAFGQRRAPNRFPEAHVVELGGLDR